MIITRSAVEKAELIDGPVGKLEVICEKPHGEKKGIGVVCHPHPLFGGTMHNKVVTTLAKTLQHAGLTTIRFNFRGVGRSEGVYGEGDGEVADLLAVVDWLEESNPQQPLWLAGFSFGAYIAARASTEIEVHQLITVAPPVQNFPMKTLPPILCPWILVQGEKDDVVPSQEVLAWAESREPKPVILRFPEAGHYFHGQLTELRTRIEAELKT
jgi:alpha/beta superfamily hydrolase